VVASEIAEVPLQVNSAFVPESASVGRILPINVPGEVYWFTVSRLLLIAKDGALSLISCNYRLNILK